MPEPNWRASFWIIGESHGVVAGPVGLGGAAWPAAGFAPAGGGGVLAAVVTLGFSFGDGDCALWVGVPAAGFLSLSGGVGGLDLVSSGIAGKARTPPAPQILVERNVNF